MIPIGDNTPRHRKPWVNYLIVASCVLTFLFELGLGSRIDEIVHIFGVIPASITALLGGNPEVPALVALSLVTALFLHAGWLHLLGNMLFLWIFGDNVEDRLGHLRYLAFYLVCGIGANLVQVASDPGSPIPLIGASGAIAGVLGAYLVLYPRAWITVLIPILFILWPVSVPVVIVLLVWFLTQLGSGVMAITEASQATGGVGYWAHVGGFVIGALLINFFPKTPASSPVARGRVDAPGCPRPVRLLLVGVGNAITLMLIARLASALFIPRLDGVVGALDRMLFLLTDPLVVPFSLFLPAIRLGGPVLELYTLLALLVYQLVIALLLWLFGLICSRSRARSYTRD